MKYIFFDVDGTLTNDNPGGIITKSVHDTLHKLQENGHFIAIATGRSYTMAKEAMTLTGIKNVVCNGGNALVLEGKVQYIHPLPFKEAMDVIKECIQTNIPFSFSQDDSFNMYSLDDRFTNIFSTNKNSNTIMHIINHDDLKHIKEIHKIFIALDKEHEHLIQSKEKLGYARYFADWLIIEPDDKYKGILDMVKQLNGDINDIVVFGDGHNDLSMVKQAPISIAMGNAIDELKEVATFITKDNKSDGIEYACKHFGWID